MRLFRRASNSRTAKALPWIGILAAVSATPATLPRDWRYEQQFSITEAGLVKLNLPVSTLTAARPELEDVRLYDDSGNELPYLIETPKPLGKTRQEAASFQVSLGGGTTMIRAQTGTSQPLAAVLIETPATNFIKAVRIDGSADGENWQTLTEGQPIFRRPEGPGQLRVGFSPDSWPWLRLSIDDQSSSPIPITGLQVETAELESVPSLTEPASIAEIQNNPGETRLTVSLRAANLTLSSVSIETDEPLFTRSVMLSSPQLEEDSLREVPVGEGVIYRFSMKGQAASVNLSVPIDRQVRSRELLIIIRNENSPPLQIRGVRVERRPVYLLFMARQAGTYHLLMGNPAIGAPRYDVQRFSAALKAAPISPVQLSAVIDNPEYRPHDGLDGLQVSGAALDISEWQFRKPIQLTEGSVHQLELDLDVLSQANNDLSDLRIMHGNIQVPYLLQHLSVTRTIVPVVALANDSKAPRQSRWKIQMPRAGLPITRVTCVIKTAVFQRDVSLSEQVTDERGNTYRRVLGHAIWVQTPDRRVQEFALPLDVMPESDTLFLEMDNGDNAPVELTALEAAYTPTRLLFKAKPADGLFLYYGDAKAQPPRYDLTLVAQDLIAADRTTATLGAEETLNGESRSGVTPGRGGVAFWGVLALVVTGLLFLISRLLPKPQ